MRKENIYLVAASLVLVAGLAGFFASRSLGNAPEDVFISTADPNFKPQPNANLSFEADIVVDSINDSQDLEGMIQHDGRGTVRFEAKQASELIEVYITPTETILCSDGRCFSEDFAEEDIIDVSSFIYRAEDLIGLGEGLQRGREVECGDRTCQEWKSPSVVPTAISTILLEKTTNRIISIEGTEDDGYIRITFDYKDVQIVLPLNATPATTE